ncbi:hypothetical protein SFRURICE_007404 [Spodoptera frugiperda]|uniref:SFRICE_016836 n=1 Tax=Spodoptera frugiperda TaxID=7108 RepID=A0A2H1VB75_SPOFR|nr:hypothetical protein SFRURICE_007404 [Spodoptera frugiperda]
MATVHSREFWSEFLQLYRSFTCLWNPKDPAYLHKYERQQAYEALLAKMREVDETASMALLKKKIDCFRTAYRREERKVIRSIQEGDDEIYTPSLWYYKPLKEFLGNIGNSHYTDDHRNSSMSFTSYENDNDNDDESQTMLIEHLEESSEGEEEEEEECNQKYSPPSPPPQKKRKIPKPIIIKRKEQEPESPKIFAQPLSVPQTEEDDCATFATNLKVQMRNISTEQKYIAQKLISDVMFLARTNRLTYNSSINLNLTYKTITLPSKSNASMTVIPDSLRDGSNAVPFKIKTNEQ